jgi:hypothetical protein
MEESLPLPSSTPDTSAKPIVEASIRPTARAAWALWIYGAGIAFLTLGFAWRYPLAANYASLTDIGKLAHYAWPEFAAFVGGGAIWFGCYLLALRASRRLPAVQAMPAIFGCAAFMALGMYWMYPVNAIDIFLYAVRSRVLSSYGANPSAVPFSHFPADPWMAYITPDWAARVSPYGPLWNLLAAPITWLAGDQIVIALVGLKVLMVLALLAGGWVIARALAAAGSAQIATGALLYLWNPIVLWEGIGNGHNDVLLTLALLLALSAWAARRDRLVIPLLVVAALIKYVSLPLIPLAAIAIWRRAESRRARAEVIAWSVLLSMLAVLLALYPFFDLPAIWNSLHEQGAMFYTSPAAAAIALLNGRYPFDRLAWAATWAGRALLGLAILWQAGRVWRHPAHLPRACFEVLFVLLLVAMPSARSWYVIWLVGLAALLPWGWPAWRAIAWSAGALASYGLMIWIEAWWQPGYATMQVVAVPSILGGTLLVSLAELAWRAHRVPAEPPRMPTA